MVVDRVVKTVGSATRNQADGHRRPAERCRFLQVTPFRSALSGTDCRLGSFAGSLTLVCAIHHSFTTIAGSAMERRLFSIMLQQPLPFWAPNAIQHPPEVGWGLMVWTRAISSSQSFTVNRLHRGGVGIVDRTSTSPYFESTPIRSKTTSG